jgi:polar amino acid transport system substrate-binding protein
VQGRGSRAEEDTVKLTTRLAALSAVTLIAAACSNPSSAAPTQGGGGASASPTQAAPTDEATPVTIAPPTDLITAGTLTDCVDIEYPPMEFFPPDVTDPNQAIGFDVDAARAVADRFGLEIDIRSTAFNALIADLQAGRCDIVWSALYVDEERLQVADAVPYMATGQVVMVAIGNPPGIAQESDLCGKKVSIQGGGLVERRINKANSACEAAGSEPIDIQAYGTVAEELQQIVSGRVDAVWETDTAVSNFILEHPNEYEVAYALPRDDNYGVYYEKGNTDVGDALTAAIAALKADGTLASIAQQYAMDPAILEVVE